MTSRILTLIFFVLTLVTVVYSFQYPPSTRLGPLIVGIPATILGLVQVVRENFIKKPTLEEGQIPAVEKGLFIRLKQSYRPYLEIGACLAGLLLAIYLMGLVIAYAVFIIVYLRLYREGWLLSIALGLGTAALIYGVFYRGLGVILYKGILLG